MRAPTSVSEVTFLHISTLVVAWRDPEWHVHVPLALYTGVDALSVLLLAHILYL